jgi:hypothetical protein
VVIHSSLSGTTNEEHVKKVGADAYVAKYSAEDLSRTLRAVLHPEFRYDPAVRLLPNCQVITPKPEAGAHSPPTSPRAP